MNQTFLRDHWIPLAVGVLVLLVLLGLAGTCQPDPEVNSELARTARVAVESAAEARKSNDAAYLWPGRLRMLAVALGVSVPIIAAVVLVWISTRSKPCDLEFTGHLERMVRQARIEARKCLPDHDSEKKSTSEEIESKDSHLNLPQIPPTTKGEQHHDPDSCEGSFPD